MITQEEVLEVIRDTEDSYDDIDFQAIEEACFDKIKDMCEHGGYGKDGEKAKKLIEIAEDILFGM